MRVRVDPPRCLEAISSLIVLVPRATRTESIEVLSIDSTVAISCLYLEELGYFGDKKDEIHEEGSNKDNSRNSGEEEQK